jgi:hypothetical protein
MVTSPFFLHYPYPPPPPYVFIFPFVFLYLLLLLLYGHQRRVLQKRTLRVSVCPSSTDSTFLFFFFLLFLPSRSLVYFHIINTHKARAFHSIKSHISPFFVDALLSLSLDRDVCV